MVALILGAAQAVAGGPQPGAAERPAVSPQLNQPFTDPDFDAWTQTFEHPGREVFDQRFRIAAALGLQRGQTVADVGAGTGLFTLLFARAVGATGRVYAVDISQSFLDKILERTVKYHVDNVVGILGTQRETGLAPSSLDLAFVCDTYHHFEYPQAMLASIARALRPDGELVVIDYERIPGIGSPWVLSHVRAGEARVTEEIEAAGFVKVGEEDFLRENWFARFRKREPEPTTGEPGAGAGPAARDR
jgi:ubiquinone/menaquinone biosynthesis C-methylase UbiE